MSRSPGPALLLAAGGIGALCVLDACVKHLQASHAVLLVTFIRYLVGSVVALGVWQLSGRPVLHRRMWRGHLVRGILIGTTAFLFFWSLTVLTLAETVTLTFTAPLMIPVMARVMLGERLQRRAVLAGLVGFGGVIIAVAGGRFAFAGRELGLAAILTASVTYALTAVYMRKLSGDGSTLLVLTGAAVPALLLLPVLVLLPAGEIGRAAADRAAWPYFIAIGIVGNVGIQLLTRAYARAEAQLLAPIEFTALPWASLFGWLFFGESVAPQMWAGGAVIIGAGLWSSRPPRWVAP